MNSIGVCMLALLAQVLAAQTPPATPATYPALPSETPAKFEPATDSFDHIKRDVMIPMRDGVKLHPHAHALQRYRAHQPC